MKNINYLARCHEFKQTVQCLVSVLPRLLNQSELKETAVSVSFSEINYPQKVLYLVTIKLVI